MARTRQELGITMDNFLDVQADYKELLSTHKELVRVQQLLATHVQQGFSLAPEKVSAPLSPARSPHSATLLPLRCPESRQCVPACAHLHAGW